MPLLLLKGVICLYGWRARIGLIIPMDNAVIEPELYSLSHELEGITFHSTRLTTAKMEEMPDNGIEMCRVFKDLGTDINVYACAETAFLKGVDGNQYISEQLEKSTGKPSITAMSAMIESVKHLDIKNITLVTPYGEERNEVLTNFFARMGITVIQSIGRTSALYFDDENEPYKCNIQPTYTAYRMAKEVDHPDSDATIISATNFRTFEIISRLEKDLKKPVITTNQAILWSILRTLGLQQNIPQLGKLFAD